MRTLFDEHVKKQFDGYTPEVPAHIWENIEAAQRRKKPVPFWIFGNTVRMAAAILFLTAGATILYFSLSKSKKQTIDKAPDTVIVSTNTGTQRDPLNDAPLNGTNKGTGGNENIISDNISENKTNNNNVKPIAGNIDQSSSSRTVTVSGNKKHNSNAKATITTTASDVNENTFASEQNVLRIKVDAYDRNEINNPDQSLTVRNINKIKPTGNVPCPPAEKDAAGNKTYIEFYGGPDYAFKSYSDTTGSGYLQQRKSSVSPLFAFSAGFRYTRVFSNGASFRTGINYSQVNDRFRYVKGNVIHNIYITNTGGDTTGSYTESGTQYQTSTNKQRTIDIPLVLGYELGNGRLHANVNAGAMVNISNKQTGYTIDQTGKPVNIAAGASTASSYSYRTNAGVSLLGAVSLYYKMNDRLHLMAEPYLRYGLSPVTKQDLTFKQKNHTAGLRLGLRVDLN